jgi:glycosyltransferase involved in cell wall biosynthesis
MFSGFADFLGQTFHNALSSIPMRMGNLRQYEPRPLRREVIQPHDFTGRYPSIAIVTPSFNQARFIERTLKSVLGQAYPALRYAVVDGGSEDGTMDILRRMSAEYQFKYISEKDRGQSDAINKGFSMVDGEIMAWLNSDDILLPRALLFVGSYFDNHPEVDVIYGHRILINEDDLEIGRWITPPFTPEALRFFDFVPQETLFWRRRIWEKVGGNLNVDFHFALDWDLLQRFANANAVIRRLPTFLGCFRVHKDQKTSARAVDIGKKEMSWLRPDINSDPALKRRMRRIYYKEQLRSQFSSLLLHCGLRSTRF